MTYSRMEEELERPSAANPTVHFTSTLPSAVCESASNGGNVASPGSSVGTAARTSGDCVGASKDSLLEELAELDGRESLDAIVHPPRYDGDQLGADGVGSVTKDGTRGRSRLG